MLKGVDSQCDKTVSEMTLVESEKGLSQSSSRVSSFIFPLCTS